MFDIKKTLIELDEMIRDAKAKHYWMFLTQEQKDLAQKMWDEKSNLRGAYWDTKHLAYNQSLSGNTQDDEVISLLTDILYKLEEIEDAQV